MSAGVPQRSFLGPLFFLADDTSIFQVVSDVGLTAGALTRDLAIIQNWAFQWKMIFNPDATKQAKEILFSTKRQNQRHPPPLIFNEHEIIADNKHKHLGLILDERLTFTEHVHEAIIRANGGIGIIRFLTKCRSYM